jgi:hypothetical protein
VLFDLRVVGSPAAAVAAAGAVPAIASIAAVAAAATGAVTAAAATTTAATAVAAATAIATTAAAAAAATTTEPTGAGLARACLVDGEIAAAEVLAVEGLDCGAALVVVVELDEGETAGPPCLAIHHERGGGDIAVLREELVQLLLGAGERQVTDIKLHSNASFSCP